MSLSGSFLFCSVLLPLSLSLVLGRGGKQQGQQATGTFPQILVLLVILGGLFFVFFRCLFFFATSCSRKEKWARLFVCVCFLGVLPPLSGKALLLKWENWNSFAIMMFGWFFRGGAGKTTTRWMLSYLGVIWIFHSRFVGARAWEEFLGLFWRKLVRNIQCFILF